MKKYTYINGNASSSKATEAIITNLNPAKRNQVYTITEFGRKHLIGYLHEYDGHLREVISYGTSFTKQYCNDLRDGLMIGYDTERGVGNYEEANNNRKLFLDFLKRYMAGEFIYRDTEQSKPKYYDKLAPQVKRNIKRVMDTLNDIYAA